MVPSCILLCLVKIILGYLLNYKYRQKQSVNKGKFCRYPGEEDITHLLFNIFQESSIQKLPSYVVYKSKDTLL